MQLELIEWHDLPIAELSLKEDGVRLVVTPWDDKAQSYLTAELLLQEIEGLEVEISGSPTADDLKNMEVTMFEFVHLDETTISGSLGILPGMAGYWKMDFQRARWVLSHA